MLSKEERTYLSVCAHCGSKLVDVITVPGGWLELVCEECGEIWWFETKKHVG